MGKVRRWLCTQDLGLDLGLDEDPRGISVTGNSVEGSLSCPPRISVSNLDAAMCAMRSGS